MSNPIDEAYEATKTAGIGDALSGFGRGLLNMTHRAGPLPPSAARGFDAGRRVAENGVVQNGLAGAGVAGGAALVGGLGAAASRIYEGIARKSEYREMMSVNPELEGERERNPEFFAQAYNSLRRVNPTFGRDPVIASAFMQKMMAQGPATAGQTLAATVKAPTATDRNGLGIELSAGPMRYSRRGLSGP